MTTTEVLEKARELIADPERWTQGHYAQFVESEDWTRFCATGAIYQFGRAWFARKAHRIRESLASRNAH